MKISEAVEGLDLDILPRGYQVWIETSLELDWREVSPSLLQRINLLREAAGKPRIEP
jgi:hypothetical protein